MTAPARRAARIALTAAAVLLATALTAACATRKSGNVEDLDVRTKVAAFACPASATSAGEAKQGPRDGKRLQVVTTVAPITSIVANIAGDRADVFGSVPEGTNSHTYEPKPSIAAMMTKADIVFANGLKLEDPTLDLAEQNIPSGGQVVQLGTLALPEDLYIYDFSFPKEGGKPNPHLWTNPPMAKCYAQIAASVLSKADPANADYYAGNLGKYTKQVDELDRLMVEATKTVPASARKLLTYHDAYAYFAAHYGWQVIGAIQVASFADPTPREVAGLIKQIKDEKVPAIFGSEVFPSTVLEQIGKETNVKYVDVLRDDDLPGAPGDAEHSFLGLMQFDFATMVASLGGNSAALLAFDPSDVAPDRAVYPQ